MSEAACAALDRFRAARPFSRLGLAVSGGGDSMALLHIAADWARERDVDLFVATVDHGLRSGSGDEARSVAARCATLGLPHETIVWTGWNGRGNLQDEARKARRSLLSDWAEARAIADVATGHTRDDQAETFLMRLARGSGVDGLSAMRATRHGRVRWLRPLLELGRSEMRSYLGAKNVAWHEDPSNDDLAFDRVKARRALATLNPLGLEARRLAETSTRMALAREGLEHLASMAARATVRLELGDVIFDLARLDDWPQETRLRLGAQAIRWVTGAIYRPRLAPLERLMGAARTGTLGGALFVPDGDRLRVTREAAAADGPCRPDEIWDGRWRLTGPAGPGDVVARLGAGIRDCPDWRNSALPRSSLLASPAVWRDGELRAAPLADFGENWDARLVRDGASFYAGLVTR